MLLVSELSCLQWAAFNAVIKPLWKSCSETEMHNEQNSRECKFKNNRSYLKLLSSNTPKYYLILVCSMERKLEKKEQK